MKSTINNTEMSLPSENKDQITKIIEDKLSWMDANQTASTEELKDIKKETEETITKLMQSSTTETNQTTETHTTSEPTIEEID